MVACFGTWDARTLTQKALERTSFYNMEQPKMDNAAEYGTCQKDSKHHRDANPCPAVWIREDKYVLVLNTQLASCD